MAILIHEVWTDAQGLTGMCLAGPMGEGFRAIQGEGSKLVATIQAGCRFEAMTKYYAMFDRGPYDHDVPADHEPYSEQWLAIQGSEIPR